MQRIFIITIGEIVFKLQQNWDAEFLESSSSAFQILEGNVRSAVSKTHLCHLCI